MNDAGWYFVLIVLPIIGGGALFFSLGAWWGLRRGRRRERERWEKQETERRLDIIPDVGPVEHKITPEVVSQVTPYTPSTRDDHESAPMLPAARNPDHRSSMELHDSVDGTTPGSPAKGDALLGPSRPSLYAPEPSTLLTRSKVTPAPDPSARPLSSTAAPGSSSAAGAAQNEDVARAINALAEALREQRTERPGTPSSSCNEVVSYRETDAARLHSPFDPLPPEYQTAWRGSDAASVHSTHDRPRAAPVGPRRPARGDSWVKATTVLGAGMSSV